MKIKLCNWSLILWEHISNEIGGTKHLDLEGDGKDWHVNARKLYQQYFPKEAVLCSIPFYLFLNVLFTSLKCNTLIPNMCHSLNSAFSPVFRFRKLKLSKNKTKQKKNTHTHKKKTFSCIHITWLAVGIKIKLGVAHSPLSLFCRGGSTYGPNRHLPPLLTDKSCKFSLF